MGIGLLGLLFFLNYRGKAIPGKEFWFVMSAFMLISGGYFFTKNKLQKLSERSGNTNIRLTEIELLKRTGDRVRVTLDNAEIKNSNFQQEIINDGIPSRIEMLDALYDGNRNYKTQEIQQTYIIFYKQYKGKSYKFVSPAINQNEDVIKRYIDTQKGVDLYIDPINPANYYFDLAYL